MLDRFGQIEPKVLFAPDGYFYAGKTIDVGARVTEFMAGLPTVTRLVTVPLIGNGKPPAGIEGVDYLDKAAERDGVVCYGAGGVGGTKMKVHRAAVARLFERNDQVLDAEEVYALAQSIG